MPRDNDIVIEKIRALHPDAAIEQLKVKFPGADDDGLWFFRIPSEREDIQVESSTGVAPFVVERGGAPAVYGASIDKVVSEVVTYLDAQKKSQKDGDPDGQRTTRGL